MSTIPASQIVSVVPNVLSPGGQALVMNGVFLTTSTRVPIGAVQPFPDAASVGAYFGLNSVEYSVAQNYFLGFDNSNIKPANLYFAQYHPAAVAGYLRGGSLSGMTLTQLQAITADTLTVTIAGSPKTSASINLSSATSFSNAAALIQAAFTAPGFTVAFDSVSSAFVFTSTATGAIETIAYATSGGSMAASLKLTQATGAVLSQGADLITPSAMMDGVVAVTQNWATFMTVQDPDVSGNTNKLAFCAWVNAQGKRYAYVCWDVDVSAATVVPATTSLGYLIGPLGNNYGGVYLIGGDGKSGSAAASPNQAAYVCGAAASIDFTETNGRITFAFKSQEGLQATCTDGASAKNLAANGYNFYGAYATANETFVWNYPGKVSGDFLWFDSYINEIWATNSFQLAFMVCLQNNKSIPYNLDGYTLLKAAALDTILQGLNFGAWRAGVTLSNSQIAEVNSAAGIKIDADLSAKGWYLQIKDALPTVRVARGSPPMTFWYMDGQSVQQINLVSVDVQ